MRLVDTKQIPIEALQPWEPAAKLFARYSSEQVDDLNEYRNQHGDDSILPIVVSAKYEIVDGYNRYRAATNRGDREIACQIYVYADSREQEIHSLVLNAKRRHLDSVSAARAAARLAELYRPDPEATKEKQREAGKEVHRGKGRTTRDVQPLRRDPATDKAASDMGVSPRTVRAVSKVDATNDPELIGAMESRAVSVSEAAAFADLPESERKAAIGDAIAGMQATANALRKPDATLFIGACCDAQNRIQRGWAQIKFGELSDEQLSNCMGAVAGLANICKDAAQEIKNELKRRNIND